MRNPIRIPALAHSSRNSQQTGKGRRRKGFVALGLTFGLLLLFTLWTGIAMADPAPELETLVRCDPPAVSGPTGSPLSVDLYVENVEGLYGADVRLLFDTTIASVVDADPGSPGVQIQPLYGFLFPDLIARRDADNGAGTIWYAATQLNPREPVTGSGSLASVTFQSHASGSFIMPFTSVTLADRNATPIPASIQPCLVSFGPPADCPDFDGNGMVDLPDIVAVAVRWPLTAANPDPDGNPLTPNYDPIYDLNNDEKITVIDIMLVSGKWNQLCVE